MSRARVVDPNKQLQVKINVCKRMVREVAAYEQEVKTNEGRVERMREEQKDPYDIKKQEEVLGESYMMVPNSKARLRTSVEDLASYLADNAESVDPELLEEGHKLVADLESQGA